MQGSPSMEDVNYSKIPFWKDHLETTERIPEEAQLFSLHISESFSHKRKERSQMTQILSKTCLTKPGQYPEPHER